MTANSSVEVAVTDDRYTYKYVEDSLAHWRNIINISIPGANSSSGRTPLDVIYIAHVHELAKRSRQ